jgi:hypothetical protein
VERFPDYLPLNPRPWPWLRELAAYEWARFLAASACSPRPGDWLNPALALRSFRYSVSELHAAEGPAGASPAARKEPVGHVIFRHPRSEQVRTLELAPAAFALLREFVESGLKPEECAALMAGELGCAPEAMAERIRPVVELFTAEGILL